MDLPELTSNPDQSTNWSAVSSDGEQPAFQARTLLRLLGLLLLVSGIVWLISTQDASKPPAKAVEDRHLQRQADLVLLNSELLRAKARADWSQAMYKKGFVNAAQVKADHDTLNKIKSQINAATGPSTP